MGAWPALIEKPKVELGPKEDRDGIAQHKLKIETAPGRVVDDAYLLVPPGKGPFPAVVVVFYEANTGIGKGKAEFRDFALQLAKRGFVTLSLGGDPNTYYPDKEKCRIQPLSFHAYEAANCHTALANMPNVDPKRIGVVGPLLRREVGDVRGGLHDKFACCASSDPGIVFDEKRGNVNYWEPWYLGFDPALAAQRKRGIPNEQNPRTGPYKKMMADRPRPARTARADGPAAVPRVRRCGRPAGAVEGAEPQRRGEQAARRREPRRDDQPQGALARPPSRTNCCTCSSRAR